MTWLWHDPDQPHDLPTWAFVHLVMDENADGDVLSRLKCLERRDWHEGRPVTLIRIFDPGAVKGLADPGDFTALDAHPDRVLYEGYHDESRGEVRFLRREGKAA